nr:uncharacterized protein LOC109158743 [Ipomoea batatas]
MEGVKMNAQEEDTSDGDKFMNDGDQECIPETQQSTGIPTLENCSKNQQLMTVGDRENSNAGEQIPEQGNGQIVNLETRKERPMDLPEFREAYGPWMITAKAKRRSSKGSRYAVLNEDGITEIDTEEQNECEEVLSILEGENNRLNKQGNLGGKGKRPAVIVSENQIMGQKEQPPQMHIGGAESSKNKDRVNRGIKGRTSNQAAASDEHTVVIATDHGNKVTRTTVNINKEGLMMHGVLELNMNEHHNDPPNGDDVHMVDSTVIANGSVGSGTSPVGLNASLA